MCLSDNCEKKEVCICQDCHRTCRSEECYRRHTIRTESGSVPCELVYKCPTCHKFVEHHEMKPEDHKCGHFTCKSCRQYVDPEHLCYARSYPPSEDGNRRFIFADIETSQKDEIVQCEWGYAPRPNAHCEQCLREKKTCTDCRRCQHCLESHCGKSRHSVVLAVCQTACTKSENADVILESTCKECGDRCERCSKKDKKTKRFIRPPCPGKCGFRERVFKTLYDLGSWIFHENHGGYTVVFHNLSYDGPFLLQYLLSQTVRPSFIIYRGSKVQMFLYHFYIMNSYIFFLEMQLL